MKSISIFVFGLALVFALLFSTESHAQCTWDSVYAFSWETAGVNDTNALAGASYSRNPQNYQASPPPGGSPGVGPHQGSLYLYLNFSSTAGSTTAAGTQFYDRTFQVCPGAQYRLSFWVATTFAGAACDITANITDGAGPTILATTTTGSLTPVQTWRHIIDTITPTSNTIHLKMITNVAGSGGGNDLAMDDLLLQVCQSTIFDTVTLCGANARRVNLFDSINPALPTGGIWSGAGILSGGSQGTYDTYTNSSGVYNYSLFSGNGCPNGLAQVMVNNNTATANLGPDDTVPLCTNSSITLSSPSPSYSNLWSTSSTASSIVVSANGDYWLQVTHNGCAMRDTVHVEFVACTICPVLTITHDTLICPSTSVQMNVSAAAGNIVSTVWTPNYRLSSTTSASPIANPAVDTTYRVTVTTRSNNSLIFNGDFSQGNTGFSSAYTYTTVQPPGCGWGILGCDGYYTINTNPRNTHSNFASYSDHTSGTGQMLIANGSQNPALNVWCENITVLPNTTYQFAAWVSTCVSGSALTLPHLKFTIDGVSVSPSFTPSGTAGVWSQFFALWTSGASTTSINICISDSSNQASGNDFAIDDITFNAVCVQTDSVRITTYKNPVFTMPANAAYCDTIHQILTPTITGGTGTFSYLWPFDNSHNQSDTVNQPGTYTLYMSNQCANSTVNHSTTLTLNQSPRPNLGNDTAACNAPSITLAPTFVGATPLYHTWSDGSTGTTLTATAPGIYWLRDSNSCGTGTDSVNVTFNTAPTHNVIGPADITICAGSSTVLGLTNAPPASDTLTWNDGTHGLTVTASVAGRYDLTVRNQCGAVTDTSYVHLMYPPTPSTLGGPIDSICAGSSVVLTPTPLPDSVTLIWQNGGSTGSSLTATTARLYILDISNRCFTVHDSVTVVVVTTPPAFTIGNGQGLCSNRTLTLRPTPAANPLDSWLWQDNTTITDSFVVSTPGTYTLTETNLCGPTSASVTITPQLPPTASIAPIPLLCDADSVLIDPTKTDAFGYVWSNGSSDSAIYAHRSGVYTVTVSNNCGTVAADVNVTMIRSADRPFNDMTIDSCTGAQVVLDAGNPGHTYLWSSGFTGQVFTVDSGTYSVTISDSGRCPIIDTVYVHNHLCPHCRVLAPSAFTPNNDGKNDKFKPVFECSVEFFSMKIYNRWGEKIYESYDQTDGWDGVFKAINQPMGVYVYFIQYKNAGSDEEKSMTGNLSLMR